MNPVRGLSGCPILSPGLVVRVNRIWHDVEAESYDRAHQEIIQDEVRNWARLAQMAAAHLPYGPAVVLDVGAGTGFAMASFWPQLRPGDMTVCLDISVPMLRKAVAKMNVLGPSMRVACVACEAGSIALSSGNIQVILMNSVLHHLPEPERFLAEVDRLLAPGGVLVLAHEPNARAHSNPVMIGLHLVYRIWRAARWLTLRIARRDAFDQEQRAISREVVRRLREQKVISDGRPADEKWVMRLVDFHSPTAGGAFLPKGGFDPDALIARHFPNYQRLSVETYGHLGKIRVEGKFLQWVDQTLRGLMPQTGSTFSFVVRKPA
jgi:ubiquinone/menaquinone biosynthesis C-methylase UbiE